MKISFCIQIKNRLWQTLGGFNESFLGCGLHDVEYLRRNKDYVRTITQVEVPPILNSKDDTKKYTAQVGWSWNAICAENLKILLALEGRSFLKP